MRLLAVPRRLAFWVVFLGLVVAACTTTPSISTAPEPTFPACEAEDVVLIPGEAEGAGGQVVWFAVAGSTGDASCLINPGTRATLMALGGRVLAMSESRVSLSGLPAPAVILDPASGPPRSDGGRPGQATLMIFFGNACVPGPFAVEVTIVQTGTSAVGRLAKGGRCEDAAKPISINVTALEAAR